MNNNFIKVLMVVILAASFTAVASARKVKKVVYIINGSLGDQSFFDAGQAGIDAIKKKYKVRTKTLENSYDVTKFRPSLQAAMMWKPDVVFSISYGYEKLLIQMAVDNPKIVFVNLEPTIKDTVISSVEMIEEEGSFMAGALAALVTTADMKGSNPENIIGLITGEPGPVISQFIYGYQQGAQYIDRNTKVLINYAGVWDDPVKGKQLAKQMYAQKADVIYQVASLTGIGVLDAAKETGHYAIGVDTNQNHIQPGFVITSMEKKLDVAIINIFETILNDTYTPGIIIELGAKENVIDIALDKYSKQILPKDILSKISKIRADVKNGNIKVQRFKE